MNDEHPTQPTDVLPEQDGTLIHNEAGAANGIAHVAGPGGAMDDAATGLEAALHRPEMGTVPSEQGAIDEPAPGMTPAGASDAATAAPAQEASDAYPAASDLPAPAPASMQAGSLDQDTA